MLALGQFNWGSYEDSSIRNNDCRYSYRCISATAHAESPSGRQSAARQFYGTVRITSNVPIVGTSLVFEEQFYTIPVFPL